MDTQFVRTRFGATARRAALGALLLGALAVPILLGPAPAAAQADPFDDLIISGSCTYCEVPPDNVDIEIVPIELYADSDGDGLTDGYEQETGTNPFDTCDPYYNFCLN